jgi:uncharacterized protein
MPKFEDNEQTLAELRERLEKTKAFLASVPEETIDGSVERTISITLAGTSISLSAVDYVLNFGLPNFYFHVTTAHAILRNQGVAIGKRDYLGPFG